MNVTYIVRSEGFIVLSFTSTAPREEVADFLGRAIDEMVETEGEYEKIERKLARRWGP